MEKLPIIIDASVAIKWFVKEEGHEASIKILSEVLDMPSRFAVPELFFYELANVLNRLIIDDADPRIDLFERLLDLNLTRSVFTKDLLKVVRRFQHYGLSGYDASYVALAEIIGGRWITADKKAHEKIKDLKLSEMLNMEQA